MTRMAAHRAAAPQATPTHSESRSARSNTQFHFRNSISWARRAATLQQSGPHHLAMPMSVTRLVLRRLGNLPRRRKETKIDQQPVGAVQKHSNSSLGIVTGIAASLERSSNCVPAVGCLPAVGWHGQPQHAFSQLPFG